MTDRLRHRSNPGRPRRSEQKFRNRTNFREKTVKKTLIGTFVLTILAGAAPAMAQDSDTFVVQTAVPPFCSQFTTNLTPLNLGSLTGTTGQIVSTFDGAAQTQRQLSASFYCNAPSTITIKADPLMSNDVPTVTDSTSFTNRVDYTATIKWNAQENAVSSAAVVGQVFNAPQANIGEVSLRLSNPAVTNNRRPVAGGYAGQVHLSIALAQ